MTSTSPRKPSPSRRRKSISTHIVALRRLGVKVEVLDLEQAGGPMRVKATLPQGMSRREADEKLVTRAALAQLVKESEGAIIRRLTSGGFMAFNIDARKGGGYEFTPAGLRFGTQVGSLMYFEPKKTIRTLKLTPIS